ncbi:MAG: hypothetical protein ABW213_15730 [Tardiphaga sp.]
MSEPGRKLGIKPVAVVAAIAVVCVVALIFLVRDRWHSPEIKSPDQARNSTTGEVAHGAGAILLPTDPKLSVEPKAPGPKRAQPAIPN